MHELKMIRRVIGVQIVVARPEKQWCEWHLDVYMRAVLTAMTYKLKTISMQQLCAIYLYMRLS